MKEEEHSKGAGLVLALDIFSSVGVVFNLHVLNNSNYISDNIQ